MLPRIGKRTNEGCWTDTNNTEQETRRERGSTITAIATERTDAAHETLSIQSSGSSHTSRMVLRSIPSWRSFLPVGVWVGK